jgi:hypothetical protein
MSRLQVTQPDLPHISPLVHTVRGGARRKGTTPVFMGIARAANAFPYVGGILYGLFGFILNLANIMAQSQWTNDHRKRSIHVRRSVVELELSMTLVRYPEMKRICIGFIVH